MALAADRCQPCSKGTPALTDDEVAPLRGELHQDWRVENGALRRSLRFPTFGDAFACATRIALIAESEGHHPDLSVGWGYLEVELLTHAIGGLSRNDFIVAARIDAACR